MQLQKLFQNNSDGATVWLPLSAALQTLFQITVTELWLNNRLSFPGHILHLPLIPLCRSRPRASAKLPSIIMICLKLSPNLLCSLISLLMSHPRYLSYNAALYCFYYMPLHHPMCACMSGIFCYNLYTFISPTALLLVFGWNKHYYYFYLLVLLNCHRTVPPVSLCQPQKSGTVRKCFDSVTADQYLLHPEISSVSDSFCFRYV